MKAEIQDNATESIENTNKAKGTRTESIESKHSNNISTDALLASNRALERPLLTARTRWDQQLLSSTPHVAIDLQSITIYVLLWNARQEEKELKKSGGCTKTDNLAQCPNTNDNDQQRGGPLTESSFLLFMR
jgi:hypothetical protein